MKKALGLIVAIVCMCSMVNAAPEKLKVMILDGQNNHNWKATTPIMKAALENSGRFTVDVLTSPDKKAQAEDWDKFKPAWSKYDVILNNYNGKNWPQDVQASFVDYMKNGGGLVVIHAADNSFGKWVEYNKMIGLGGWGGRNEKSGPYVFWKDGKIERDMSPGNGGSHGPQWEYPVDTRDSNHPIMKGMPASWKHAKDELYANLRGPAENMTVLATSPSKKTGKHEPALMAINYGKGRIFHSILGHGDKAMKCAGFISTLERGTEWAATGKVTIPIPNNFPGPDAVVVVNPLGK